MILMKRGRSRVLSSVQRTMIAKKTNMPKILEDKLKREYPNNPHAVYGTMNKIGAMHGNKETSKGKSIEKALARKKK